MTLREDIVIKIYSDDNDFVSLNSAVAKLKNTNVNILIPKNKNILIEEYEILFFKLSGIESPLLQQIIEVKKRYFAGSYSCQTGF